MCLLPQRLAPANPPSNNGAPAALLQPVSFPAGDSSGGGGGGGGGGGSSSGEATVVLLLLEVVEAVHEAPLPVRPYTSSTAAHTLEQVLAGHLRRSRPLISIRVEHAAPPRATSQQQQQPISLQSAATAAAAAAAAPPTTTTTTTTTTSNHSSAAQGGATAGKGAQPQLSAVAALAALAAAAAAAPRPPLILGDRSRETPVAEMRPRRDPAYELQRREVSVGLQACPSFLSGYADKGSQAGPWGPSQPAGVQADVEAELSSWGSDSTGCGGRAAVPALAPPRAATTSTTASGTDPDAGIASAAAASAGELAGPNLPPRLDAEVRALEAAALALLAAGGVGGASPAAQLKLLLGRAAAVAECMETGAPLQPLLDAAAAAGTAQAGDAAGGGRSIRRGSIPFAGAAAAAAAAAMGGVAAPLTVKWGALGDGSTSSSLASIVSVSSLTGMSAPLSTSSTTAPPSPVTTAVAVPASRFNGSSLGRTGTGGSSATAGAAAAAAASTPIARLAAFLAAALPTTEIALSQNETLDIFSPTEAFLGPPDEEGEADEGGGACSSSSSTAMDGGAGFRELRQFMDLELTNNKALAVVEWCPRAAAPSAGAAAASAAAAAGTSWLAASATASLTLEQRLAESDVPRAGHVLLLSTAEFAAPVVLVCPSEVTSLAWNPHPPTSGSGTGCGHSTAGGGGGGGGGSALIVVGLVSGQVALFDLRDAMAALAARSDGRQGERGGGGGGRRGRVGGGGEGGDTRATTAPTTASSSSSSNNSTLAVPTVSGGAAASLSIGISSSSTAQQQHPLLLRGGDASTSSTTSKAAAGGAAAVIHLQPKFISAPDAGHARGVVGLRWLPPSAHLNGRMLFAEERPDSAAPSSTAAASYQFLSVGAEGSVCVWDTRFQEKMARTRSRTAAHGGTTTTTTAATTTTNGKGGDAAAAAAAAAAEVPWIPHFRSLVRIDTGASASASATTTAAAAPDHPTVSNTSASSSSTTTTAITCFSMSPWNAAEPLVCGTDSGRVAAIDWAPPGEAVGVDGWIRPSGGTSEALTPKAAAAATTATSTAPMKLHMRDAPGPSRVVWLSSSAASSRPVIAVLRSPFRPGVFAAVYDHQVSVWARGCGWAPLLTLPPAPPSVTLTAGRWSPTRPSVLLVGRSDGVVEAWDLLESTVQPVMSLPLVSSAVSSLEFRSGHGCSSSTGVGGGSGGVGGGYLQHQGSTGVATPAGSGSSSGGSSGSSSGNGSSNKQLLAVGDAKGTLHILEVPSALSRSAGGIAYEDGMWEAYLTREAARSVYVAHRAGVHEAERVQAEAAAAATAAAAAADAARAEAAAAEGGGEGAGERTPAARGGVTAPPLPPRVVSRAGAGTGGGTATTAGGAVAGLGVSSNSSFDGGVGTVSEAQYAAMEAEVMAAMGITAQDISVIGDGEGLKGAGGGHGAAVAAAYTAVR